MISVVSITRLHCATIQIDTMDWLTMVGSNEKYLTYKQDLQP